MNMENIQPMERTAKRKHQSKVLNVVIGVGVLGIILVVLSMIKVVPYGLFKDPEFGVQMKYPSYWEMNINPAPGAIAVFLVPRKDASDMFQENVSITYFDNAAEQLTFSQLTQRIIKQTTLTFAGIVKVVESRPSSIRGRPAYWFMIEGVDQKDMKATNPVRQLFVWTVIGDKAYIISYAALRSDYSLYLDQVKTMIRSFGPLQTK